jgi:FKBP-type peptidyl-prolyl cis-trans isomerase SlyD
MSIENNKVVTFHYRLSNEQGEQLDSSHERAPMTYLQGSGSIVAGLEKAMAGKSAGEQFEVNLEPAEAYGERSENSIQRISAKLFKQAGRLVPGQLVVLNTSQGQKQVTVVKVGRFNVDVDTNHPLAGQSLTFEVEISDVRDATKEEVSHGHPHGPGGVDH